MFNSSTEHYFCGEVKLIFIKMLKSQTFFQPEMEVVISVQESLLEGTQIDQGNLMTLTIESLYSPPESWTMTGSQYAYAAALPIPMSADVSERVDD